MYVTHVGRVTYVRRVTHVRRVDRIGGARMTTHVLWVIVHSLAVVVFVNRYVAGIILRVARGKSWDECRDDYEPTVTAIIPMFNEGAAIKETLESLLSSAYPHHKLSVICV